MPASKAPKASKGPDTRQTLESFLRFVYARATDAAHAKATPLADVTQELGIAPALAAKIATFLEGQGLIEYADQTVDITVTGMLQVEKILRGDADADER